MILTRNEEVMIEAIRELRPYESVNIQKDANGRPDFFIINREQKVFLTDMTNKLSTKILQD
jgi:hypothetical protein